MLCYILSCDSILNICLYFLCVQEVMQEEVAAMNSGKAGGIFFVVVMKNWIADDRKKSEWNSHHGV